MCAVPPLLSGFHTPFARRMRTRSTRFSCKRNNVRTARRCSACTRACSDFLPGGCPRTLVALSEPGSAGSKMRCTSMGKSEYCAQSTQQPRPRAKAALPSVSLSRCSPPFLPSKSLLRVHPVLCFSGSVFLSFVLSFSRRFAVRTCLARSVVQLDCVPEHAPAAHHDVVVVVLESARRVNVTTMPGQRDTRRGGRKDRAAGTAVRACGRDHPASPRGGRR